MEFELYEAGCLLKVAVIEEGWITFARRIARVLGKSLAKNLEIISESLTLNAAENQPSVKRATEHNGATHQKGHCTL